MSTHILPLLPAENISQHYLGCDHQQGNLKEKWGIFAVVTLYHVFKFIGISQFINILTQ